MRLNPLALSSFKKNLRGYFSLKIIKSSFLTAFFLSAFIYFYLFDSVLLSTLGLLLFIFGLIRLLSANAVIWSQAGFFVGIFWFYWISFSLRFYDMGFLIPLEILFIGIFYGVIFGFFGGVGEFLSRFLRYFWLKKALFALLFFATSFTHPFGFNWLNYALPLINTPFESVLKSGIPKPNTLKIELMESQIEQKDRWKKELKSEFDAKNLAFIDEAIKKGADLVILPESAFAYSLNRNIKMINELLERSKKIAILSGAEAYENGVFYNSAYFFNAGEIRRIDKKILVPFGEEIPLPAFLKKPINELFFGGASDFGKASDFSYIEVKGAKIKVGICYEGTRAELYEDKPDFVAVISNNAWFAPSTESALQRLLLRYYAFKNGASIFHATNASTAEIIN